jgi:membrane associated rhomboid family serine protease
MSEAPGAGEERIALAGGRAATLFESGLGLPHGASQRFIPYAEVIHVALGARALRIGTERGTVLLPRRRFAEPTGPATLAERLRQRTDALPDGARRRALAEALDRRQRLHVRPRVGPGLALLCIAFHALASWVPSVQWDGEYYRVLGLTREPWRLVTSQLLHADAMHLLLNGLGLLVLGAWLERQAGAARTALAAAVAAVGAMLGSVAAGYESVVGASGVVMGFAGGLIALELRRPDLLPAALRLPRGLLLGALAADFLLLSFVPNVAHAAHVGGLAGGALGALATAPDSAERFAAGPRLSAACALAAALVTAALAAFGYGQLDPGRYAVRRAEHLVELASAPALLLNNDAWTIATSGERTEAELELALRLARRAVRATGGLDANLLDTLAEVYFQLGRSEAALETIDAAIALRPGEPYFREQRRRFTGERAADDRPAPPSDPPPDAAEPEPAPEPLPDAPADTPAIRV